MSFVVHFVSAATAALPHPLGDPGAVGVDSDAEVDGELAELSADEVADWDLLEPSLVSVWPSGVATHDDSIYTRQLMDEDTGMLVAWEHDDYQVSIPFWSSNASGEVFNTLGRVVEVIEGHTGLVGVDEISEGRFLDHSAELQSSYAAIADGFEQAMEQQTVFGRLKAFFHRD